MESAISFRAAIWVSGEVVRWVDKRGMEDGMGGVVGVELGLGLGGRAIG